MKLYRCNRKWGYWKRVAPSYTSADPDFFRRIPGIKERSEDYLFIPWWQPWKLRGKYRG